MNKEPGTRSWAPKDPLKWGSEPGAGAEWASSPQTTWTKASHSFSYVYRTIISKHNFKYHAKKIIFLVTGVTISMSGFDFLIILHKVHDAIFPKFSAILMNTYYTFQCSQTFAMILHKYFQQLFRN